MFQLRIYTLRSADALTDYATIHWARHVPTFAAFGITIHGIWTERDADAHRLIALISFPDSVNPTTLAGELMASPEFEADMAGFDPRDIVAVDSMLLDATQSAPVR